MQAKTAQVKILDLEADTVELLLRYCYGCLQKMPSDHCQVCPSISSLLAQALCTCIEGRF